MVPKIIEDIGLNHCPSIIKMLLIYMTMFVSILKYRILCFALGFSLAVIVTMDETLTNNVILGRRVLSSYYSERNYHMISSDAV